MATSEQHPWGRVDETGTVYVREGDGERAVGQYPDGTPEEALAYFERKYTDLAGQVDPARAARQARRSRRRRRQGRRAPARRPSTAPTPSATSPSLQTRLDALGGTVEELTEQQTAEAKAALDAGDRRAHRHRRRGRGARRRKTRRRTQWKQTTAALDDLFARWQKHQHDGPRLPKNEANELWKRFRAARTTIEHNRKAFFAELDYAAPRRPQPQEGARSSRPRRSSRAAPTAFPSTARLLDQWKAAGRAGKKNDDALWARFKAAGDVIYSAKAEVDRARRRRVRRATSRPSSPCSTRPSRCSRQTDRETARDAAALHPGALGRRSAGCRATRSARRRPPAQGRGRRAQARRGALAAQQPREEGALRGSRQPAQRRDRQARGTSSTRRRPPATARKVKAGPGGARRPQGLARRARLSSGRLIPSTGWPQSTRRVRSTDRVAPARCREASLGEAGAHDLGCSPLLLDAERPPDRRALAAVSTATLYRVDDGVRPDRRRPTGRELRAHALARSAPPRAGRRPRLRRPGSTARVDAAADPPGVRRRRRDAAGVRTADARRRCQVRRLDADDVGALGGRCG